MRVLTTEPFPPLLGIHAEIAVITLQKYIDDPLELKEKFQNYASFVGKSEHFQSSHLKKEKKKVWLIKAGMSRFKIHHALKF